MALLQVSFANAFQKLLVLIIQLCLTSETSTSRHQSPSPAMTTPMLPVLVVVCEPLSCANLDVESQVLLCVWLLPVIVLWVATAYPISA